MAELKADGPKLYEWFVNTDANLEDSIIGQASKRRLNAWKHGEGASLDTVDALCVKVGLHLSQVPDELWMKPPKRVCPRSTKAQRLEAVERVRAGEKISEVAASTGHSRQSVANWVKKHES